MQPAYSTCIEQIRRKPDSDAYRIELTANYATADAHKRTYNTPTCDDIAALLPVNQAFARPGRKRKGSKGPTPARSFSLALRGGEPQVFPNTHPMREAMQFPMFRPPRDRSWHPNFGLPDHPLSNRD